MVPAMRRKRRRSRYPGRVLGNPCFRTKRSATATTGVRIALTGVSPALRLRLEADPRWPLKWLSSVWRHQDPPANTQADLLLPRCEPTALLWR